MLSTGTARVDTRVDAPLDTHIEAPLDAQVDAPLDAQVDAPLAEPVDCLPDEPENSLLDAVLGLPSFWDTIADIDAKATVKAPEALVPVKEAAPAGMGYDRPDRRLYFQNPMPWDYMTVLLIKATPRICSPPRTAQAAAGSRFAWGNIVRRMRLLPPQKASWTKKKSLHLWSIRIRSDRLNWIDCNKTG